jgi:hypothetical protein
VTFTPRTWASALARLPGAIVIGRIQKDLICPRLT